MATKDLIEKAKLAMRQKNTAFDSEVEFWLDTALKDLGFAGVVIPEDASLLVERAQITFCKMNFGEPEPAEYDRLKASYDEQKAQLSMCTGFTDWGDIDG